MSSIPQLRHEHLKLMAAIRRLGATIERKEPPPPLHLRVLRHELSSTLMAHLQLEDWLLYPPLLASSEPDIADTALRFSEEMGSLADAYREHCQSWNADAVALDWAGYSSDCRRILDALAVRITRENRELYPLLEELDRAAQRVGAAAAHLLHDDDRMHPELAVEQAAVMDS